MSYTKPLVSLLNSPPRHYPYCPGVTYKMSRCKSHTTAQVSVTKTLQMYQLQQLPIYYNYKKPEVYTNSPAVTVTPTAQVSELHQLPRCHSYTNCPGVMVTPTTQVSLLHQIPSCDSYTHSPVVIVTPTAQVS